MKQLSFFFVFCVSAIPFVGFAQQPVSTRPQGCPQVNLVCYDSSLARAADSIVSLDYKPNGISPKCNTGVRLIPRVLATTGSDNYIVDSIPYNPPCAYNEGGIYPLSDDDKWGPVYRLSTGIAPGQPRFKFQFYGNTYEHLVIGTNGLISFDTSYANQHCAWNIRVPLPNAAHFRNAIMGPYYDIHFGNLHQTGGGMRFQVVGEYPCRRLVLSYDRIPMFSCTDSVATHMIVLYETTNIIEFYLKKKTVCMSWNQGISTMGIQNAAGTRATTIPGYNATVWSARNEAWRIRPQGNADYLIEYSMQQEGRERIMLGSVPGAILNIPPSDVKTMVYAQVTYWPDGSDDPITFGDSCLVNPSLPKNMEIWQGNQEVDTVVVCEAGQVTLNLEHADRYFMFNRQNDTVWINNPFVFTPQKDSLMKIHGLAMLNGETPCVTTDSVYIHYADHTVNLGPDLATCKGDSIWLVPQVTNLTERGVWTWSCNGRQASDSLLVEISNAEQDITLTITDTMNCPKSDVIHITGYTPEINITGTDTICLGDTTKLICECSMVPLRYEWIDRQDTTESITVFPRTTTTYTVNTYYGLADCKVTDTFNVAVPDLPITRIDDFPAICPGEELHLKASGTADQWEWTSIQPGYSTTRFEGKEWFLTPYKSSYIILKGTDRHHCFSFDSAFSKVHTLPEVRILHNPNEIAAIDPVMTFEYHNAAGDACEWRFDDEVVSNEARFTHRFELPASKLNYKVCLSVTNGNGCIDSVCETILVERTPNVVAPNALDIINTNDQIAQFRVYIDNVKDFELCIFDRWGQKIFQTNDINEVWDATGPDGKKVSTGIYVWTVRYSVHQRPKNTYTDQGTITIY